MKILKVFFDIDGTINAGIDSEFEQLLEMIENLSSQYDEIGLYLVSGACDDEVWSYYSILATIIYNQKYSSKVASYSCEINSEEKLEYIYSKIKMDTFLDEEPKYIVNVIYFDDNPAISVLNGEFEQSIKCFETDFRCIVPKKNITDVLDYFKNNQTKSLSLKKDDKTKEG